MIPTIPTVDSFNSIVNKYLEAYKNWIVDNSQLASDIESAVKWLSYLTVDRIKDSTVLSELVYALSNILVLFNDQIIFSSKYSHLELPQFRSKLKIWLTIVEYTEAFLEVSARKKWGENGRWLIIWIVQTLKTVMRLFLVYRCKERITQTPPVPTLKREKLEESCARMSSQRIQENGIAQSMQEGYALKHSGKIVRSINCSEPLEMRVFKAPVCQPDQLANVNPSFSTKSLAIAETLYIVKPLLHLACLSACDFKTKKWEPWALAFMVDIISLRLFSAEKKSVALSKIEKEELVRRQVGLLLYIVRSPFYDNYSKMRIIALLRFLSNRVPFARLVADPLEKYLPQWQNTYFYTWSC